MQHILLAAIVAVGLFSSGQAQTNKFFNLRTTAHFNFGVKAPNLDDAGIGGEVDAIFFANRKLNLLMSANADRFIGDKSYTLPDIGRANKGGAVEGVQIGPQYYVLPSLAVSAAYGWFRHSFQEIGFSNDDGYRVALVFMPGKNRKLAIQLSRTAIPAEPVNIRFYSFGIGYRIL